MIKLTQDYRIMKKFFAHETAIIDKGCIIGDQTKVWHFSHIMKNAYIGKGCNIGQNVVISPVKLGRNVKVQNNVSIYTGVEWEDDVFLGPSMVFIIFQTQDQLSLAEISMLKLWLKKEQLLELMQLLYAVMSWENFVSLGQVQ